MPGCLDVLYEDVMTKIDIHTRERYSLSELDIVVVTEIPSVGKTDLFYDLTMQEQPTVARNMCSDDWKRWSVACAAWRAANLPSEQVAFVGKMKPAEGVRAC